MGHTVNRIDLPALPKAEVSYEPSYEILFLENGKSSEVAEEMARRVLVYFDRENEDEVVAVRIDSAEWVLKPFVDAMLAKHDIPPEPELWERPKKGHRETVVTQIRGEEWALAPYSESVYDTASQTLLVENGEACEVTREMAKSVHVLYGRDYDGGTRLASVAIRIEHAETVLKPFVDAILIKYGGETKRKAPDGTSGDQPIPDNQEH